MRVPNRDVTLEELKYLITVHKEEGRKIVKELQKLQSHYEKMETLYSDWEDDMVALERIIDGAKSEHSLPIEKIEEYDVLADALGGLQND